MRPSIILTLLLLAAAPLHAQAPASSKSVTLDVTDSAGGSTMSDNRSTYYGSSSRTKAATRELTINVRNMSGTLKGDFEIEWYFFGKPTSGTKRFIYDMGSKKIALAPSAFEKVPVESAELSNYRYRSGYSGYTYQSGDKPDGWIVRVKVGGEVVRVKASSAQLEQLEKSKDEFERFVKTARVPKTKTPN